MTASQLYAAIIARPITEDRLRKAQKQADTMAVYATVLDRLAREGRWPLVTAESPVMLQGAVWPAGAVIRTGVPMTPAPPPKPPRARKTTKKAKYESR